MKITLRRVAGAASFLSGVLYLCGSYFGGDAISLNQIRLHVEVSFGCRLTLDDCSLCGLRRPRRRVGLRNWLLPCGKVVAVLRAENYLESR